MTSKIISNIAIFIVSSIVYVNATNLLVNNSFENGSFGWQQWGSISTTCNYVGANTLKISNAIPEWSGFSQDVLVLDDVRSITVGGWMKTDSVAIGSESWETATIGIELLDENGAAFASYSEAVAKVSGTTDWKYYEKNYAISSQVSRVKLFGALGNTTGTVCFDEFTIIQKRSDGSLISKTELNKFNQEIETKLQNSNSFVDNGSFVNGMDGWENYNTSLTTEGRHDSSALLINNVNVQWGAASQKVMIPENAISVAVSCWMKCDTVVRGENGWDKALLSVEFYSEADTSLSKQTPSVAEVEGTTDWSFYHQRYIISPESHKIKLASQLCNTTGKVLFDDISVVFFDESGNVL